jgi:aminopeptidase 2
MQSSDHGVFSASVSAKVLSFFETYFDYPYDFPKMDTVAIPQFGAGAMENWGLNLYQTGLLLITEGETTASEKGSVAAVLAHELSHQWWGNLVTLRWWNDIWLNEGFASYMSPHGTNSAAPEFEPFKTSVGSLQNALQVDAGPESTPVHMDNEEDVVGAPGAIIYDKGSCLIRMMQGFLTEETLIGGLRKYLKVK